MVEGVGDHGCEYMTNGTVVILGSTGRNFAAGMSGGIAYVFDRHGEFVRTRCNRDGIDLEPLFEREDIAVLEGLIRKHVAYTGSPLGRSILDNWSASIAKIVKVFPQEYKRVLATKKAGEQKKPAAAALPREEVLAAREGWR